VLSDIPASIDDRVLVDFRTADDAGVYRWESGPALVQTVDFFTPIVDDPYVYGQIAAANALSDVYAMGGVPLTALAIAAFPKEGVEPETIRRIFRGGFDKLREAGVSLLGGHTVQDQEIKFGYAVTGSIDPSRVLTNAGARAGDVLFLTKPLGTGIVGTAIKFDRAETALADAAVQSMRTLNRAAADALRALRVDAVHACTDVTGFGLIGHATEMARASGVTIAIDVARVPVFDGVLAIAAINRSGGMATNEEHFGAGVRLGGAVPADRLAALYDPQTSGGLLVAAAADAAPQVEAALRGAGVPAARIGRAEPLDRGLHIALRA